MTNDAVCGTCSFLKERSRCGNSASPHADQEVDRGKDTCSLHRESVAARHVGEAIVHFANALSAQEDAPRREHLEQAVTAVSTGIMNGLVKDMEIEARVLLGRFSFALSRADSDPFVQRGIEETDRALLMDREGQYGYFEDVGNRRLYLAKYQLACAKAAGQLHTAGRVADATSLLREKLQLVSYLPGIHMPALHGLLGTLLEASGNRPEALELFERATKAEPLDPESDFESGIVALAQSSLHETGAAQSPGSVQKKGCMVVTVVAGGEGSKEVLLLQRFKQDFLQSTLLGRFAIWLYYKWVGPYLAARAARSRILRLVLRQVVVTPAMLVAQLVLQERG